MVVIISATSLRQSQNTSAGYCANWCPATTLRHVLVRLHNTSAGYWANWCVASTLASCVRSTTYCGPVTSTFVSRLSKLDCAGYRIVKQLMRLNKSLWKEFDVIITSMFNSTKWWSWSSRCERSKYDRKSQN